MRTTAKPLAALTVDDLMSRDVVFLPETMPLRDAARLLVQSRVGGAPVVDATGKCVGVLSGIDFLHLAASREDASRPAAPPLPYTCSFQIKERTPDGKEVIRCTLPPGVCPLQISSPGAEGEVICSQPHCVLTDWQMVKLEELPTDEVRQFMTPDPVTTKPDTPIRELARMMLDAHIHRVIVVDDKGKPIGIVSGTDVLAAVAYGGGP